MEYSDIRVLYICGTSRRACIIDVAAFFVFSCFCPLDPLPAIRHRPVFLLMPFTHAEVWRAQLNPNVVPQVCYSSLSGCE